jgi:proteasome assembly chaperone (PAC2) family protein
MIAVVVGAVGVLLGLGLISGICRASVGSLPRGDDSLQAAVELHRIGRRFDIEITKVEIHQNARETERRMLRDLGDGS